MSIDNLTKAERNAFNSDLAKEMNLEAESEARRVRIEEMVAEMTKEGNAFYPFLPDNFHEAITQMSDENVEKIGAYAHVIANQIHQKIYHIAMKCAMVDNLLKISREYWENTARIIIERDKLVD